MGGRGKRRPPRDRRGRPAGREDGGDEAWSRRRSPVMVVIWAVAVVPIVTAAVWEWRYGEASVTYAPWLLEQVERGNVESLKVQGTRVAGRLRAAAGYQTPRMRRPIAVRRFVAEAPSMAEAGRLVADLRGRPGPGGERPRVEWGPPASWWWLMTTSSFVVYLASVPIVGLTGFAVGYFLGLRDGRSAGPPVDDREEGSKRASPAIGPPLSDPGLPTP